MKLVRKSLDGTTLELNIPNSSSISTNTNIEIEQGESIIIIGANGSGKSRFCGKVEILNEQKVHRIAAQKNLVFEKQYSLSSYEDSMREVFYGEATSTSSKRQRWGWNEQERYVKPVVDCAQAIKALFAQKNKDDEIRAKQAAESHKTKKHVEKLAPSVSEKLEEIWNIVLPNRPLDISDLKIKTTKNGGQPYEARFMSDGERDVLYYLAVCLCLPQNIFVVLDEPENHIHNSIINKLFGLLEKARPDLTFIYATHNLEFAAEHTNAKKLWFKDYDGTNWDYHILGEEENLPESLLLEILGSKEKILLVEGEKNSLDTKLYQAYYRDYKVIGCGGCQQVVNRVRAFNTHTLNMHYDVKGIVDRDYRTDEEIAELHKDNIFVCQVAEVENLFIVPEVISYIAKVLGTEDKVDECIGSIKAKFDHDLPFQKVSAINSEVKFQIGKFDFEKRDLETYKKEITDLNTSIKLVDIITAIECKFNTIHQNGDYREILKIYNQKNVLNVMIKTLGYSAAKLYQNKIISLVQDKNSELLQALSNYLPQL